MTYLECVNAVLRRLRESTVASVSQTTYSSLVGEFINDAKRAVEDAWQWSAQLTVVSVSITSASAGPYNLSASLNERAKIYTTPNKGEIVARCSTSGYETRPLRFVEFSKFFADRQTFASIFPDEFYLDKQNTSATSGQSRHRLNTVNPSDGNYTFQILFHNPQNALASGNDEVTAPNDPIIQLAYLYCLYERGEELGEFLTLTETKAKSALVDAVSIDTVGTKQDLIFTNG